MKLTTTEENEKRAPCLIKMNPKTQQTHLLVPPAATQDRTTNSRRVVEEKGFTFDNSFWSHDKKDKHYAHQSDVYNALGEEFLDHNFEGYHTCIFAYGQTGSGKSYTMMGGHGGTPEEQGLIPRTCEDLFQRIESNASPNISYSVRVSYFEVYNEHVRDLLVPRQNDTGPHGAGINYLKIRESPTEGTYIKDLTDAPVKNFAEIMRWMKIGDASRTTASTKMNDTSSRSHAVFTIMLKQIHHDMDTDETTERTARIRLVDLAGSERAKATEATGARLREGSNINKSLTTLGRVIAALADNSSSNASHKRSNRVKSKDVVPYRDSILTWLLKDSLGGNSKTAMIACISPTDYDETLSTLRYADQAKRIRTRAIVNQDSVSAAERDAQITAMQDTIRALQLSVSQSQALSHRAQREVDAQQTAQLEEYQTKVEQMQRLMEETRQVSECKIRGLQEQNEALRRHLKLAVESLKNPISVGASPRATKEVPMHDGRKKKSGRGSLGLGRPRASVVEEEAEKIQSEKENVPPIQRSEENEHQGVMKMQEESPELDEPQTSDEQNDDAADMQRTMEALLQDLGMFRKKVKDDHGRFGAVLGRDRAGLRAMGEGESLVNGVA
jgi:hypothetical protein